MKKVMNDRGNVAECDGGGVTGRQVVSASDKRNTIGPRYCVYIFIKKIVIYIFFVLSYSLQDTLIRQCHVDSVMLRE